MAAPERAPAPLWPAGRRESWGLATLLVLGLVLRLAVWHWHELYPLGGDEREYFNQALTWLRGQGYHDLPLMRPPLYPVFLAVVFRLFDSQVQRVRLVQALVSEATIYLEWLLAYRALAGQPGRGPIALAAAALIALNFTLAGNATELLTETVFLFGLCLVFVLLLSILNGSARTRSMALSAGVATGLLTLVRSVALPLLALGGLVLLGGRTAGGARNGATGAALLFVLAGALTIAPWTARNYLRFGKLILVDTTGPENLWLDNDPRGREAVKRELYALGDDRGARQALAMRRGVEAILADPPRFGAKVADEATRLVALQYWDDLRERPAIWVSPVEVWLRLLLGDGFWLILALAGGSGIWLLPRSLAILFVPWTAYVVATGLLFHVELRYRLPLYPVLAISAPLLLLRLGTLTKGRAWRSAGTGLTAALVLGLMLLHRPYPTEAAMLIPKHWSLWRGDAATALRADPESALARVALARAELRTCDASARRCGEAERLLREAIAAKPAHPYAHLLLGALLHERGDVQGARRELQYETHSLEDLQHWLVAGYAPRGRPRVDIGDGLDLGEIEGFQPAEDGYRWSKQQSVVWLGGLERGSRLRLRLASGRPAGAAAVLVHLRLGGRPLAELAVGPDWQTFDVPLPPQPALGGRARGAIALVIDAPTFRPRDLDRASDDNRRLGIKVDWVEYQP